MIGRTISHYKILSKLGEGGMGVVYKAEDLTLQRTVALKFLPPDSVATASDRSRLLHEARAAAVLLHPNICPVYEIGESDGHTFIAMGYLEGRSLKDRLSEGPLAIDEALKIAREIGEALSAAHGKGIVHRDVKPGNVMVTPEGRAVLMDFGLAKMTGATKLTRTGTTVGTVAYMSPEQMQGREVDHRTDLWALGVMLYEMVSGELPFQGDYEPALFYAIANADPKPLSEQGIPAGLEGIIVKALAKRAADRYQTARELIEDIEQIERDRESLPAGRAVRARGPARLWKRWRPWERVAAVSLTCVILAAIAYGVMTLLTPKTEVIDSIGVLPLKNLTGDPAKDEIVDGFVSAVSASLGSIDAVQVRSPQTMMQFKESTLSMNEIGRRTKAEAIMEGSCMISASTVQLSVQLYDAEKDRQIYSRAFTEDLQNLLALSDEIARDVAGALARGIRPGSQASLTSQKPVNPAAIEAYLKGLNYRAKPTAENAPKAIEYLEKAVAIDSTFGKGYADLAFAYSLYAWVGLIPADEAVPKAKENIDKALALDPNLPQALGALADYKYSYERDFAGAEELFRRTFELDPNLAEYRNSYAFLLSMRGNCDEAVKEAKLAKMLDPLNTTYTGGIGVVFHDCLRFDSALVYLNKAIAEDSAESWSLLYRSSVFATKKMYPDALADAKKAADINEQHLPLLGAWYVNAGDTTRAKECFQKVLELAPRGYWGPATLAAARYSLGERGGADSLFAREKDVGARAFAYCCIGKIDRAFDVLEGEYQDRARDMVKRINSPWLVFLKRDPRYTPLLQKAAVMKS